MKSAVFALEDGSVFRGQAFGATKTMLGEATFNTSMIGYQELLTDPSNYKLILLMTSVEMGCYGICPDDNESDGAKVSGFVVAESSSLASSWRSNQSLNDYLVENDIPAISGIDTRAITKKLRITGALKACLSTEDISDEEAVNMAKNWVGLEGVDFVKEVTCKEPYYFDTTKIDINPFTVAKTHLDKRVRPERLFKCAAIDFGAKTSILKNLAFSGFDVTVFPAQTTAEEIEAFAPEAIFLSNGPGDPSASTYAHETVKALIGKYPMFGICFGHQVIAHALGAKTYKLKFGHRGANHPVKNLETDKITITSNNHGFAVDAESLEKVGGIVTEINLNDNTVAGMRHKDLPLFSVQYHPEASPGPTEASYLFDEFYKMVKNTVDK